jgi:hypothetical protein
MGSDTDPPDGIDIDQVADMVADRLEDKYSSKISRRAAIGGLLGVGGLGAMSGSASGQTTVGGGEAADAMSDHAAPHYTASTSEIDETVTNRFVTVTQDDANLGYSAGDLVRTTGSGIELVSRGYEALGAESVSTGEVHSVSNGPELEDAISNVSDGDWIKLSSRIYTISGWQYLDGVTGVVFEGDGDGVTTIKTADGADSGQLQLGANSPVYGIRFKDITFDGNAANNGGAVRADAVRVVEGYDVKAVNCTFQNTPVNSNDNDTKNSVGFGAYYPSQNIRVVNCDFDSTGYRGVESSAKYVKVLGCHFDNLIERHVSPTAIRVDNRMSQHMTVKNNTMVKGPDGEVVGAFVSMHGSYYDGPLGASTGDPLTHITIKDNTTVGTKRSIIAARQLGPDDGPINIEDNDGSPSDLTGIALNQGNNSANPEKIVDSSTTVAGNTVPSAGGLGIFVENQKDATVEDNDVPNATNSGIFLSQCVQSDVTLNDVETPGIHGIRVSRGGRDNSVENNTVEGAQKYGVRMATSDSKTPEAGAVTDNTIVAPGQDAADTYDAILVQAPDARITDNTINGDGNVRYCIRETGGECLVALNHMTGFATSATSTQSSSTENINHQRSSV